MNSWINESIIYQIFTLGFCGCLNLNKGYKYENRLKKIADIIPNLKEMNINTVYFGPLFESTYHGYDTKDYYKVDRRLGDNNDFKELCDMLHENGIRIILDGVFNHVGREFWAFEDVKKNGYKSKYCNWFDGLNFYNRSPMGDEFSYNSWNGCYELVKLNLKCNEAVEHLLNAVKFWIDEFDIDGLRLDAADCIDFEFFKRLRKFTSGIKKDFWLMGEVIHGDYSRYISNDMLDSITNYECYKGIYSSHNDKNYFEIAYSLNRLFGNGGIYKGLCLYNFVDNHDVTRIASIIKVPEYIYNIYTLLYTIPGVPSVYYGSEFGIDGFKRRDSDDNLRPEIDVEALIKKDRKLYDFIKKLGSIRKASSALKYGDYNSVVVKNEQYVFSRRSSDELVYVILNLSDKESYVSFNLELPEAKDVLNENSEVLQRGIINVKILPFSSQIIAGTEKSINTK